MYVLDDSILLYIFTCTILEHLTKMAINHQDILQIKDKQTLFGKEMVNVYFYQVINPATSLTYQQIGIKFDNEVLIPMSAMQVQDVLHVSLEIENLTNGLDFHTTLTNRGGTVALDCSNTSSAYSFILNRTNKLTKSGGKRIGGVPDNAYVNNELDVSYVGYAQTLADAIAMDLEIFNSVPVKIGELSPVLVGTLPTGARDLTRIQTIADVTWHKGASTQVSRKILS